ncbi:unnamed protein product [Caenorhabditis auriculariae]|uniref:Tyrosine-protein phosphatase domain-containing protein n=1 Tax=Caenorhabditis auriculariae TaxID=2777116 RepID=A0A8S1HGP3_9PELO|nr:unnamed protein product [Caenorhabditis auriculariae]
MRARCGTVIWRLPKQRQRGAVVKRRTGQRTMVEIEEAYELREDVPISRYSSIEFPDEIINEKWLSVAVNKKGHLAAQPEPLRSVRRKERKKHDLLMQRIEQHELEELQTFIAQKLFKVDGIICDEQTRIALIEKMLTVRSYPTLQHDEYVKTYGSKMAGWLRDRLVPTMADCGSVLQRAAAEFYHFKKDDPLCIWRQLPADLVAQISKRIALFTEEMTNKVKWSLLVEPGKFSCHLTEFINEFRRLERMFQDHELAPAEAAQTAFNSNHITKARSKLIPCCDYTRVKLVDGKTGTASRRNVMSSMFRQDDELYIDFPTSAPYGTPDFIHANYVRGGPLMNTFICAQAPLLNTQEDFWRLVHQEKSQMIVMLCPAVDANLLGSLDNSPKSHCPYYWPKVEGSELSFGDFTIRCKLVDATADPLFTITKLEVYKNDEEDFLTVEHWQWNWQFLGDAHWPFRVLRRARLQKTPTIVQCIDGCSRSGTLVAIEVALMNFLKGAPQDMTPVLEACVFVRLQRRLAVGSMLHYLFIYRVLLRFIEPYVTTFNQRTALGFQFKWLGFIYKFESMAQELGRITPAY